MKCMYILKQCGKIIYFFLAYLGLGISKGLLLVSELLLGIPDDMHCANRACSASRDPNDSTLMEDKDSLLDCWLTLC